MRRLTLGCVIVCGAVFLSGCGSGSFFGSKAGSGSVLTKGLQLPPGTNAIVAFRSTAAKSRAGAGSFLLAAQSSAPVVTLGSAKLVIKEIELHRTLEATTTGQTEEDELEIELKGPFILDLLDDTAINLGTSRIDDDADSDGVKDRDDSDDDGDGTPDDMDNDDDGDGIPDADDQVSGDNQVMDALQLEPGIYHRIKFKVAPLDSSAGPDEPLAGLSVAITGDIDGTEFDFCSDQELTLEFRSETGIEVTVDGDLATFLITIDPESWFAALDLTNATTLPDGTVDLCNGGNPDLVDMVLDAMTRGMRVGRDDDGDGHDDDDSDDDLMDDDMGPDETNDGPDSPSTDGT